jgi:hypothetical protein
VHLDRGDSLWSLAVSGLSHGADYTPSAKSEARN